MPVGPCPCRSGAARNKQAEGAIDNALQQRSSESMADYQVASAVSARGLLRAPQQTLGLVDDENGHVGEAGVELQH